MDEKDVNYKPRLRSGRGRLVSRGSINLPFMSSKQEECEECKFYCSCETEQIPCLVLSQVLPAAQYL